MFHPLIRSVISVGLIIFLSSYKWDTINSTEIKPLNMIVPFFQFFTNNILNYNPKFADLDDFSDVYQLSEETYALSLPASFGGPKSQTLFNFLGSTFVFGTLLLAIPTYFTHICGSMAFISMTFCFLLFQTQYLNISFLKVEWPIYGSLLANTFNLYMSVV